MKNEKFVLNDQRGFTLVEAMISIFILSTIMLMVPIIYQYTHTFDQKIYVNEDFEWNLFLLDLRKELKNADDLKVHRNRIIIEKGENIIYYEVYGSTIRRRVNLRGNEIVLQQLKTAQFIKGEQTFTLEVEFLSGTREQGRFLQLQEGEVHHGT